MKVSSWFQKDTQPILTVKGQFTHRDDSHDTLVETDVLASVALDIF